MKTLIKKVMNVTVVNLCHTESCCPVVKMEKETVKIGEEGNLCELKKDEWNLLVEKVLGGELRKI